MEYADIGVIGGSGFYDMKGLMDAHYLRINTPFGPTSEKVLLGKIGNCSIAFLSRHGVGHRLSPSEVNYRANLYAMKLLQVRHLISVTAVGSLKEEYRPTDLVIPDQYVDLTYKREKTFFENGVVAHVSMADPVCPSLCRLGMREAEKAGIPVHFGGVYVNMEGPQFSTRGESFMYRQLGYSVIGMTQAVEAKLARELEMCFLPLSFVTDYDCWHETSKAVTVDMVIENLNKNTEKADLLIRSLAEVIHEERDPCSCSRALENAVITHPPMIPEKTFKKLEFIIGKYIKERV